MGCKSHIDPGEVGKRLTIRMDDGQEFTGIIAALSTTDPDSVVCKASNGAITEIRLLEE